MTAYPVRQLAKEAEREVRFRRWVYSRAVGEGRMKLDDAERRIDMMEEIARRLTREADDEEIAGRLL